MTLTISCTIVGGWNACTAAFEMIRETLNEEGMRAAGRAELPFARRVGHSFCMMDARTHVATGAIAELNDEHRAPTT